MSPPNDADNHKKDKTVKHSSLRDSDYFNVPHGKRFLINSGICDQHVHFAELLAKQNGTNIETELIANRFIDEKTYFQRIAERLDLIFMEEIVPSDIIVSPSIDVLLSCNGPLRMQLGDKILTVIYPSLEDLKKLEDMFALKPELKQNFAIASSTTIRNAVWQLNDIERAKRVIRELHDTKPELSAKALLTNWQSFFLGILCFGSCLLIYLQPGVIFIALHASFSLFYLSFNLLKLSAGLYSYTEADREKLPLPSKDLPHYTILIALYKEEQVADQLIKAMSRLKWPKSKLDIKLICEADDTPTISALLAINPGPEFEIIKVPNALPKTKPKALQYAMVAARGEFIAVYDAEDRPHPEQLVEAYRWFDQNGEKLACMQAPLVISNADAGWLTGLFSIEYASLFRRLIPLLSHFGLPIPLGGTSNHFRKSALIDVGGWDPCNVTEDADLGIRLYFQGYYTGILKRPTLETAPTELPIWIKQRTRWLKGWMQTWLVFMRDPLQLVARRGLIGFIIMQIMIGGLLVTALTHPFALIFIAYTVYRMLFGNLLATSMVENVLIYLDILNLLGGYVIFVFTGLMALIFAQRRKIKTRWFFFTPLYWLLISFAGWRALSQLPLRTQLWEKTPHEPARRK